jgi:hypothetical protein
VNMPTTTIKPTSARAKAKKVEISETRSFAVTKDHTYLVPPSNQVPVGSSSTKETTAIPMASATVKAISFA